jgi:hypothetical protein
VSLFIYIFSMPIRVCSFDSQVDILSFSFIFCFGGNLHLFQFHAWRQFSTVLTFVELCTHIVQSNKVFQALKPSRKLTTFISQREQEKRFDFTSFLSSVRLCKFLDFRTSESRSTKIQQLNLRNQSHPFRNSRSREFVSRRPSIHFLQTPILEM